MEIEYLNPEADLSKRPFYPQNPSEFTYIVEKIHISFSSATNPIYYCVTCHSIETRHSIDFHKSCVRATKSQILGKVLFKNLLCC